MRAVAIRNMRPSDYESVKAIYENGIKTGMATFETSAPDYKKWNADHLNFGRLVATVDSVIAGWAALSPVSGRCVYGGVAEISVYVAENFRGKGIGKKLLKELITESEINGIWTLQAGIFTENTASLQMHLNSGFRLVGKRERIGKLNDIWKDNFILEKRSAVVGVENLIPEFEQEKL